MVMIIMMGRIIIINLVLNYFDVGYLDYEFEYIFFAIFGKYKFN